MPTRDLIEPDATHDERYYALLAWAQAYNMGSTLLSYHRLQVERFVVDEISRLRPIAVADVAQEEAPRKWLLDCGFCGSYKVIGLADDADVRLDLLREPASDLL